MTLLNVSELSVHFDTLRGRLTAVDRVSFAIKKGETLGVVGESGCGKSITSLALMGLLPGNARVESKRLEFQGKDLTKISEIEYRHVRGGEMAMIFQDPMTSLNPSFTVGFQLMEVLAVHEGGTKKDRFKKSIQLLERVGIPDPEARLECFPHQLSGGMCQRVMIAMAIACRPTLLIADEPTTALDVTIQAQILDLLHELQKDYGMALMLITHDIAVVGDMADNILVMYAGQIVENGPAMDVIRKPSHPYTQGLLNCLPGMHDEREHKEKLPSIPGLVPDLVNRPTGCQMHPRCPYADGKCSSTEPGMNVVEGRQVKCFYPLNLPKGAK